MHSTWRPRRAGGHRDSAAPQDEGVGHAGRDRRGRTPPPRTHKRIEQRLGSDGRRGSTGGSSGHPRRARADRAAPGRARAARGAARATPRRDERRVHDSGGAPAAPARRAGPRAGRRAARAARGSGVRAAARAGRRTGAGAGQRQLRRQPLPNRCQTARCCWTRTYVDTGNDPHKIAAAAPAPATRTPSARAALRMRPASSATTATCAAARAVHRRPAVCSRAGSRTCLVTALSSSQQSCPP